ncbi:hypothetical protein C2G38_2169374 [Gigaspora rosea]|uniref:Uncharacterized protein n=1 Tax=Gigaspora rosea TaxID=44941 RepID=A0A397VS20_9GLOM|nr:hypothetical protein C2G38_2169374 [Gigaspora rosea]
MAPYEILKRSDSINHDTDKGFLSEEWTIFILERIITFEELPPINNTIVIMLDKLGRFHIKIPVPVEYRENQARIVVTIVSLDSGIRTFMAC